MRVMDILFAAGVVWGLIDLSLWVFIVNTTGSSFGIPPVGWPPIVLVVPKAISWIVKETRGND